MDFTLLDWATIAFCATMMGITKTGIPGLGILAVPLMAIVFKDTKESTGLLLGILILADVFAITYHRHNARWQHIFRLLPVAVCGIVAGYFGLKVVNNEQLKPIIGIIVLLMLAVNYWRTHGREENDNIPAPRWLAFWLGLIAGVTTMMANAAGPVMIIYLLAMRLPKIEFVGTSAWFFFMVNWIKVPFSANLGLMNAESVKVNLLMLPFIFVGSMLGIFFLKRIPQRAFTTVVQLLATAAAVKLLF